MGLALLGAFGLVGRVGGNGMGKVAVGAVMLVREEVMVTARAFEFHILALVGGLGLLGRVGGNGMRPGAGETVVVAREERVIAASA